MRKVLFSLILVSMVAPCLAGCQPSITGEWINETHDLAYHFEDRKQVTVTARGTSTTARYHVMNDHVVLSGPQGTVVLMVEDGQLLGPMGQTFTRRPAP